MTNLKSYSLKTDQGPYLHLNEDDVNVDLVNKTYMLFDGFGGAGAGDQAVRIAKETLKDFYNSFSEDADKTLPFFFNPQYILEGNALINAFRLAHQKIIEFNRGQSHSHFGGTSAIAVVQKDSSLFCVSAGNCLGLKVSKGKVEEVITPDNYRHFKRDREELPFFTAPTQALGLFSELDFKTTHLKIFEGDQLILLSDGVYSRVQNDELIFILNKGERSSLEKIEELFELANQRGNQDNQSSIILNF